MHVDPTAMRAHSLLFQTYERVNSMYTVYCTARDVGRWIWPLSSHKLLNPSVVVILETDEDDDYVWVDLN